MMTDANDAFHEWERRNNEQDLSDRDRFIWTAGWNESQQKGKRTMKIESFDTIFSLPADQLDREQIISILLDDDLQDLDRNYMKGWICEILRCGFVGYDNQTDAELRHEYTERRDLELCTYGTDVENGMTA